MKICEPEHDLLWDDEKKIMTWRLTYKGLNCKVCRRLIDKLRGLDLVGVFGDFTFTDLAHRSL